MSDLRVGGILDVGTRERTGGDALIRSSDLTTHGVIVGMTGSGKTGLGIVLVEEALAAGVPALLIDPKGDLTNLCLTFPALAATDFEPWVNESEAVKAGQSTAEFADSEAVKWQEGLAGWDLGRDDIGALRDRVAFEVYTPGSQAGRPLNIVGALTAPSPDTPAEDAADEIESYVSSLLALIGIDADPLSSREHVLLSALIQQEWGQGRDLDLATLLAQVQRPPLRKLGVLDIDQFFPPADRTALAVRLNSLLASPGFASWLTGDPIDIDAMLHSADGRPRCAIVTTAHLSDEERQSVTALVLAKLVTWMRRQPGTSDLRALLYMDEVAGYLPPTAMPPSKKPILLLMKQARAFGVGVVLSTQNPVDVDYKALSNAGTWLIGRLQTEQDKARLLDGLTSATGDVDIAATSDLISSLGKRQFMLKRAGGGQPDVLTTRWAMSYLRGPLMRQEISRLAEAGLVVSEPAAVSGSTTTPVPAPDAVAPSPDAPALADDETQVEPTVASGITRSFLSPAAPWSAAVGAGKGTRLQAAAIARVRLRYDEAKADLVHDEEYEAVLNPLTVQPNMDDVIVVDYDDRDLLPEAPAGAVYRLPPTAAASKTWWTSLKSALVDHLVRTRTTRIQMNPDLKLYSRVGETPEAFAERCSQVAGDQADAAIAALEKKYASKLRTLQGRADRASGTAAQAEARHEAEHGAAAQVATILGGVFGGARSRRSILTEAKRTASSASRVDAAREKASAAQLAILDLESELRAEIADLDAEWQARAQTIEALDIGLERTDVSVVDLRLVWIPID